MESILVFFSRISFIQSSHQLSFCEQGREIGISKALPRLTLKMHALGQKSHAQALSSVSEQVTGQIVGEQPFGLKMYVLLSSVNLLIAKIWDRGQTSQTSSLFSKHPSHLSLWHSDLMFSINHTHSYCLCHSDLQSVLAFCMARPHFLRSAITSFCVMPHSGLLDGCWTSTGEKMMKQS